MLCCSTSFYFSTMFGCFCMYRNTLYFYKYLEVLYCTLVLELYCFLSFVSFVLSHSFSCTQRRSLMIVTDYILFKLQVYTNHFGWQMQHRLQALIRVDYDGELPVGQAAIITTLSPNDSDKTFKDPQFNEGRLIKYLISAPTMRVPMDVIHSVNAYLAFRAVIRAG